MDILAEALMHRTQIDNKGRSILNNNKAYYGKIYNMISPNFRYIGRYDYSDKKIVDIQDMSNYDILHIILDYVSGMTDSYALNKYKELNGIV